MFQLKQSNNSERHRDSEREYYRLENPFIDKSMEAITCMPSTQLKDLNKKFKLEYESLSNRETKNEKKHRLVQEQSDELFKNANFMQMLQPRDSDDSKIVKRNLKKLS